MHKLLEVTKKYSFGMPLPMITGELKKKKIWGETIWGYVCNEVGSWRWLKILESGPKTQLL